MAQDEEARRGRASGAAASSPALIDASTTSRDITASPAPPPRRRSPRSMAVRADAAAPVDAERRQRALESGARARTLLACDPCRRGEALGVEPFERIAGAGGGDDQQFVFVDRRRVEAGSSTSPSTKPRSTSPARVSSATASVLPMRSATRRRIAGVEGGMWREASSCRPSGWRRSPARRLEAGEIGERLLGRRRARQHRSRFAEEGAARAGQRDAPADAIEQLDPCRSSSAAIAALVADW